jgi:GT2 family glycosyltransferase
LKVDCSHVVVVIVSYNKKNLISRCLDSIDENTSYPSYEIVVVDNGSVDGTSEMLKQKYPGIKIIRNETNIGFVRANNQAVKESAKHDPDFFFLLNNDTIVHRGWIETAVELANSQNDVGIVGCKLLYPDGRIQHAGGRISPRGPSHIGIEKDDHGEFDKVTEVDFVTGAAFLVKREVIEKIGLFDEGYSPAYFEDVDLCVRARKCGYKVLYNPKSVVTHYVSETAKGLGELWLAYVVMKNSIRFVLINYPIPWLILHIPGELKRIFSLLVLVQRHDRIFKRRKDWRERLSLYLQAWRSNIRSLPEIVDKRRHRTRETW